MGRVAQRTVVTALLLIPALAGCHSAATPFEPPDAPRKVRIGLFNIKELRLENIESEDRSDQLLAAAAIVQEMRPDILVINEIDALPGRLDEAASKFEERFLNSGERAIAYPHIFVAETNTGELAGFDFDNDGSIASAADEGTRQHGGDSFGYGTYPGEYGMALLSRFPIAAERTRTFRQFLWRDLPGSLLPLDWYSEEEARVFRVSSKSHWDVSVDCGGEELHVLMSHPTPPVFDGDEDRNGRRNFDEIKFWRLYLDGDPALYDDEGSHEPLPAHAMFVLAGDLNAAPNAPVVYGGTTNIGQLLGHARVQDTGSTLVSEGGLAGRSAGPPGYFERSTASFGEGMRIDYLLPSTGLTVDGGGVYWPAGDPGQRALLASDHRFVWLDVSLP